MYPICTYLSIMLQYISILKIKYGHRLLERFDKSCMSKKAVSPLPPSVQGIACRWWPQQRLLTQSRGHPHLPEQTLLPASPSSTCFPCFPLLLHHLLHLHWPKPQGGTPNTASRSPRCLQHQATVPPGPGIDSHRHV